MCIVMTTQNQSMNSEFDSPLSIGANKKVIKLMTDEFAGRIMEEFVALRPKMYSYLTDDGWVSGCAKQNLKLNFMIAKIIWRKMN